MPELDSRGFYELCERTAEAGGLCVTLKRNDAAELMLVEVRGHDDMDVVVPADVNPMEVYNHPFFWASCPGVVVTPPGGLDTQPTPPTQPVSAHNHTGARLAPHQTRRVA